MRRSERIRRLSRLVPWPTLLLAAACGGGDKGTGTTRIRFGANWYP